MSETINAKTLRHDLATIVERVSKGARYTVLYRSRPAFAIVPVGTADLEPGRLEDDPIFEADAVGTSRDGKTSAEHDETLYGESRA